MGRRGGGEIRVISSLKTRRSIETDCKSRRVAIRNVVKLASSIFYRIPSRNRGSSPWFSTSRATRNSEANVYILFLVLVARLMRLLFLFYFLPFFLLLVGEDEYLFKEIIYFDAKDKKNVFISTSYNQLIRSSRRRRLSLDLFVEYHRTTLYNFFLCNHRRKTMFLRC